MIVTLIEANGSRRQIQLAGERMRIGRSRDNEIFVPDPALSRFHAELVSDEEGWKAVDRGSKNGTFLNDRRLTSPARLTPGDRLDLGASRLVFGVADRPSLIIRNLDSATEERTVGALRVHDAPETALTRILVDAAREIAVQRPAEDALQKLLELAVRATAAERGLIARRTGEGVLTPLASVSPAGAQPPVISRRVLERVMVQGEALNLEDLPDDLAHQGTIMGAGIRSILCAPLGTERPFSGVLYLDTLRTRADFKPTHLEVVATLAGMANVVLETAAGREQRERLKTMEAQLQAAAEIQAALLPEAEVVHQRGFSAAARHRACQTVGGDLFDFFQQGEQLGVMLADVAGKGLAAALLMANLHARWHGVRLMGLPPEQWLAQLNEEFQRIHAGNRFISMAFALANPEAGEILFASAGHNPALLVHGDNIELMESTGPILGILPGLQFGLISRPFPVGARLVVYSDGVTDQQNTGGEPFELEGLLRTVKGCPSASPREMVERIRENLENHAGEAPQDDDTTLAVLGRD